MASVMTIVMLQKDIGHLQFLTPVTPDPVPGSWKCILLKFFKYFCVL